jgi:transposase
MRPAGSVALLLWKMAGMSEAAADEDPTPGVGVAKPDTVAQCHEVIDVLAQQVALLQQQMAVQQQQIAVLQEQLKLNSRNSSKPPSSDGPGAANRAQRRASERKRGAQKGHPGSYRAMLPPDQVHDVVKCEPPAQCECGAAVAVQGQPRRHQVFELPPLQARVSEYQLQGGRCTWCGKPHRAALPAGVPSGQLGPRALALVGMLGTLPRVNQGESSASIWMRRIAGPGG